MVAYMVIISVFTVVVQMFLQAFVPTVADRLGSYTGLIVQTILLWVGRSVRY